MHVRLIQDDRRPRPCTTSEPHGPVTRVPRLAALLIAGFALGVATAAPATAAAAPADPGTADPAAGNPAAPEAWFRDDAATSGPDFYHATGARPARPYFPEIVGGGGALHDLDGDGDLDAYLVQSGTLYEPLSDAGRNRLFTNAGDGTFTDATPGSGADDPGYGMGATIGDYDGDGDPDIYVTNYGRNTLLRNDGDNHFTDVTEASGTGDPGWGTSAVFADLDRDGDLDLFVANYVTWSIDTEIDCVGQAGELGYCVPTHYESPSRDTLYRNNGDGTFTDISESAGMRGTFGNGLGVVCADVTNDGLPEIIVANDKLFDHLWINLGDLQFQEDALIRGSACDEDGYAKAGMGMAIVDYDDDGDRDFLVVNFAHETDSYYENDGEGYFFDRSVSIGLGFKTRKYTRFGVGFRDFDNDGRLDLYFANGRVTTPSGGYEGDPFGETNLLFAGQPDGTLDEILPRGGTAETQVRTSRAAIFGDVDNDGGIDILVVNREGQAQMLRNVKERGHWAGFQVREHSGTDALGASLSIRIGDRTMHRDVISAQSYLASSDPRVHVGLASAEQVDAVTVHWADGQEESFGSFPADEYHTLRRGEGE